MSDINRYEAVETARLTLSRMLSDAVAKSSFQIFWHFHRPASGSLLLNNAWLGKGIVPTAGLLSVGLPRVVSGTDVRPALGDFEKVLEDVRAREFSDSVSRKGATFLFEEEEPCIRYAKFWARSQEVHILRCVVVNGSLHKGHLGWASNQPISAWEECARSYWAGQSAHAPPDWELVVNGTLFFPDWEKPPFSAFANLGKRPSLPS